MNLERTIVTETFDKKFSKLTEFKELAIVPRKGWITFIRNLLGMSQSQLARRLKLSKARISHLENSERDGSPTLKSMESAAEALDCTFVYALVPNKKVSEITKEQAFKKAYDIMSQSSLHMELEDQEVTKKAKERALKELVNKIRKTSSIWD